MPGRIANLFRRRRLDRELDAELRHHRESHEAEYRARGCTPEEARLAARRDLGSVAQIREVHREQRGLPALETLWTDVRVGLRSMRRTSLVTGAVVVTLAIAIGANTMVFSVVEGVLLQPLPYPDADRLISVAHSPDLGSAPYLYLTERDENLAHAEWGGPDAALGRRLRGSLATDDWREIVGVVGDVRDSEVSEAPQKLVYFPVLVDRIYNTPTYVWRSVQYVIRSPQAGTPGFLDETRQAVWAVDADLPLVDVRTMGDVLDRSMARTSFVLLMLVIAGTMALVLGVIGIYAVIAYAVSQRRREVGIRIALGARRAEVLGMFVRRGLALTGLGVAAGLASAVVLTRSMSSLLFEVRAFDVGTYTFVTLALVAAAVPASCVPSLRATRIDPVDALRAD